MAKPIEPTPVLRGEDLERLIHTVEHPQKSQNKEALAKLDAFVQRVIVRS